jgi:hypothetical protein
MGLMGKEAMFGVTSAGERQKVLIIFDFLSPDFSYDAGLLEKNRAVRP